MPRITVTVQSRCAFCGGESILTVSDWPSAIQPVAFSPREVPSQHRQTWTCPACEINNDIGLPGQVISVKLAARM